MKLTGRAHRFGDNVDTDVIIPARHLQLDRAGQALHAMEDEDPDFVNKVRPGDVMVVGRNFGCGSARPAHRVLMDSGISCVIASSFATIFMRNSVNEGLPIFKCPEAYEGIAGGDEVEADLDTGRIRNLTEGTEFQSEPFPEFLRAIIASGGLIAYGRRKILEIAGKR